MTAKNNPKYLLIRANELWLMAQEEDQYAPDMTYVMQLLALYQALIDDNKKYYLCEGLL